MFVSHTTGGPGGEFLQLLKLGAGLFQRLYLVLDLGGERLVPGAQGTHSVGCYGWSSTSPIWRERTPSAISAAPWYGLPSGRA
jgi:hypothetical protein